MGKCLWLIQKAGTGCGSSCDGYRPPRPGRTALIIRSRFHGPDGERLVGFDNAHPVRTRSGPDRKAGPTFDHKHRLKALRPYEYQDAAALLADFWTAVEEVLHQIGVIP